jgi:hypothetical protein
MPSAFIYHEVVQKPNSFVLLFDSQIPLASPPGLPPSTQFKVLNPSKFRNHRLRPGCLVAKLDLVLGKITKPCTNTSYLKYRRLWFKNSKRTNRPESPDK